MFFILRSIHLGSFAGISIRANSPTQARWRKLSLRLSLSHSRLCSELFLKSKMAVCVERKFHLHYYAVWPQI